MRKKPKNKEIKKTSSYKPEVRYFVTVAVIRVFTYRLLI
jgi:hypothetical protein